MGPDFLVRPRLSRIYYQGKFFSYPLRAMEAFRNLGPLASLRVFGSYLAARIRPLSPEDNFERWVSNRFGRALYEMFFKSYTEKVWGMPCTEISIEWAAQRIKDLSLAKAVLSKLNPFRRRPAAVSLIEEFLYPRLGPGMMWDACVSRATKAGHSLLLGTKAVQFRTERRAMVAVVAESTNGHVEIPCSHVISTMALPDLVVALGPSVPAKVRRAAEGLRFRDFLTVALVVEGTDLFPDNWIYVHDPHVQVGRVQNFRNWSPDMVPNERESVIGLEYFCNEGDDRWNSPDEELIDLAEREIRELGLIGRAPITHGAVARVEKAYPVYDPGYRERVALVREYLRTIVNLHTCGRNGLHRYNNLDHSMLTGLYAARNVAGGANDVWSVNVEEDYHEAKAAG